MNVYQKTGVFIARIVGTIMIVVAVAGLGYFFFLLSRGEGDAVPKAKIGASVLWFIFGTALIFFSKPLGSRWGKGLD